MAVGDVGKMGACSVGDARRPGENRPVCRRRRPVRISDCWHRLHHRLPTFIAARLRILSNPFAAFLPGQRLARLLDEHDLLFQSEWSPPTPLDPCRPVGAGANSGDTASNQALSCFSPADQVGRPVLLGQFIATSVGAVEAAWANKPSNFSTVKSLEQDLVKKAVRRGGFRLGVLPPVRFTTPVRACPFSSAVAFDVWRLRT